jgi:predicted HD superfamily hydrolase involved in NAD metabolism
MTPFETGGNVPTDFERTIADRVKEYISEKRFKHTLGVRDAAVSLCTVYGCSRDKAAAAALLHDVARDIPIDAMRNIVRENGGWSADLDTISGNPKLFHSHAGRAIAQADFGIEDEDVLRSIELHTTGGRSMELLDKVIFIADFIEPGRTFRGVETARRLARRNLDQTILYIFKFMLRNLLQRELFICNNTLHGYNEIVVKMKNKSHQTGGLYRSNGDQDS